MSRKGHRTPEAQDSARLASCFGISNLPLTTIPQLFTILSNKSLLQRPGVSLCLKIWFRGARQTQYDTLSIVKSWVREKILKSRLQSPPLMQMGKSLCCERATLFGSRPNNVGGTWWFKNLPATQRGLGSIPGSGRSTREGNGYPLQSSCLKNPMDRGAWWATVQVVTKS